jgi:hypothetical protein
LVDALCSGRSVRKDVMVRIHSWALERKRMIAFPFFIIHLNTMFIASVLADLSYRNFQLLENRFIVNHILYDNHKCSGCIAGIEHYIIFLQ